MRGPVFHFACARGPDGKQRERTSTCRFDSKSWETTRGNLAAHLFPCHRPQVQCRVHCWHPRRHSYSYSRCGGRVVRRCSPPCRCSRPDADKQARRRVCSYPAALGSLQDLHRCAHRAQDRRRPNAKLLESRGSGAPPSLQCPFLRPDVLRDGVWLPRVHPGWADPPMCACSWVSSAAPRPPWAAQGRESINNTQLAFPTSRAPPGTVFLHVLAQCLMTRYYGGEIDTITLW